MARQPRHRISLVVDGRVIDVGDRHRAILNALWLLMPAVDDIPAGELGLRWQGDAVKSAEVKTWFPEAYFTVAA
jgi:hypothetical protein